MNKVIVKESDIVSAVQEGMDAFLKVFTDAIKASVGGELTAETMAELNAGQLTLLAYETLRDEVMDGGFIQLIYNGYGGFIFMNPFARVVKSWGMRDLAKLIYNAKPLYLKYKDEIQKECTDEEFMMMFEKYPEFDDFDDEFVENEEEWTSLMAQYVDDNLSDFAEIEKNTDE
ncbi:MAG: DMP19 family protein [Prevotella sp.]